MSDLLNSIFAAPLRPVKTCSPSTMILIAGTKIGKTTVAGALQDCVHIVCDPKGADRVQETERHRIVDVYEQATKAKMPKYDWLQKFCLDLAKESPRRFKRAIIDKLDNVEDWADGEATAYYKNTVIGRNFQGRSVRELERGGGYPLFWDSFKRIWNAMAQCADEVIFLAALKETALDREGPAGTFSRKDMDLTGKIRNIATSFAEIIGMMSRNELDENWITFRTSDTGVLSGSRIPELEGKNFKVSWKDKDGKVHVDWSAIYKD